MTNKKELEMKLIFSEREGKFGIPLRDHLINEKKREIDTHLERCEESSRMHTVSFDDEYDYIVEDSMPYDLQTKYRF